MSDGALAGGFAAIVGAPRCGTTSLALYLGEHPGVTFSVPKEPHFFAQFDLTGLGEAELRDTVEHDYLARYFPEAPEAPEANGVVGGGLLMDGSVTYLYAAPQLEPVLRLWPDAKFIIAVRDPLALLPSLHQRLLFLGDETETDFARAWALSPERAQGRSIPRTAIDARWLLYQEIGRLGTYVERFFAAVGRERCLVVVFDDLAADPGAVYRRVLDFLGLPDDGRTDFAPRRVSRGYRLAWLQRLLKRPPQRMRAVMAGDQYRRRVKKIDAKKDEPFLVKAILKVRKRLLRWNRAPAPERPLSPEMRAMIHDALADDVAKLARLLGRDLSHWLGGVPDARPEHSLEPPAGWVPAPVET